MSDCVTKCAGCRANSNGEQYCPRCEGAIELEQAETDKRGFRLPVKVSELANGSHVIIDEDGTYVARTYLRGVPSRELAGMICDEINHEFQDCEGA